MRPARSTATRRPPAPSTGSTTSRSRSASTASASSPRPDLSPQAQRESRNGGGSARPAPARSLPLAVHLPFTRWSGRPQPPCRAPSVASGSFHATSAPAAVRSPFVLAAAVLTPWGAATRATVALPDCLDLGAVYALTGAELSGVLWSDGRCWRTSSVRLRRRAPDAPLSIFGPGEESGTFDGLPSWPSPASAELGVPEDLALPGPTTSPRPTTTSSSTAWPVPRARSAGSATPSPSTKPVRCAPLPWPEKPGCVAPPTPRSRRAASLCPLALRVRQPRGGGRGRRPWPPSSTATSVTTGPARSATPATSPWRMRCGPETLRAWAEAGGNPGLARVRVEGDVSSRAHPRSSRSVPWSPRLYRRQPVRRGVGRRPGTGDGFELFCAGETDISDASRPIEARGGGVRRRRGRYVELKVGIDGLSLITRRDDHG